MCPAGKTSLLFRVVTSGATVSHMSTQAGVSCSALELLGAAVTCVRAADPTDTTAALLVAWRGFGAAAAAGGLLAGDNPGDAALARESRPVIRAVMRGLRPAPSLPYADLITETVDVLTPSGLRAGLRCGWLYSEQVEQLSPASAVRRAILVLVGELATLLSGAAPHARDRADKAACEHGARLADELGRCWRGHPSMFSKRLRDDL